MTEAEFPAIRLQCVEGVWWFVFGDRKLFVSIGINHVDPNFLLAPYNINRTIAKYGNDMVFDNLAFNPEGEAAKKWWSKVQADMKEWHFNTLGYHTSVPRAYLKETDLSYIVPIRDNSLEDYRTFPDVFSKEFSDSLDKLVKSVCDEHKLASNLLGYAFHDISGFTYEMSKNRNMPDPQRMTKRESRLFAKMLNDRLRADCSRKRTFHPLVERYQQLPVDSPGKNQWINLLRQSYRSIEVVNSVYGLKTGSWAELGSVTDWSNYSFEHYPTSDNRYMLATIAERYYSQYYTLIKKHDPNHLILGDKLNASWEDLPDYLLDILKKYVDLVFIEWVDYFGVQENALNDIHHRTGKPILMGDSAFACIQENQIFARGVIVESQEAVGQEYGKYLSSIMKLPFVVGWHHCGYIEGWKGIRNENDPFASSQSGFLTPFEEVHERTVERVKTCNRYAEYVHRSSYFQGGSE
ncbi:hypothetical protein [Cohnella soli]|uniref:Agarase n=1 Tax=Cohnella soli TaxID=425005 RepID=A0ABW0I1Y9_9BACL